MQLRRSSQEVYKEQLGTGLFSSSATPDYYSTSSDGDSSSNISQTQPLIIHSLITLLYQNLISIIIIITTTTTTTITMAYVPSLVTSVVSSGAMPTGAFTAGMLPSGVLSGRVFPTGVPNGDAFPTNMVPDGQGEDADYEALGGKGMSDLSAVLDLIPDELLAQIPQAVRDQVTQLFTDPDVADAIEEGYGQAPGGPSMSDLSAVLDAIPEEIVAQIPQAVRDQVTQFFTELAAKEEGPKQGAPEMKTPPAAYGNSRVKRHAKRQQTSAMTNPDPNAASVQQETVQNSNGNSGKSGKMTGKDWFSLVTSVIQRIFFNK